MKAFKLIGMALLAVVFSFSFSSCSDDDDDSKSNDFISVLTSTPWLMMDGDVFVFSKDGTGYTYEDTDDYENNIVDNEVTWSYSNNYLRFTVYYYEDGKKYIDGEWLMDVISYDSDEIRFHDYDWDEKTETFSSEPYGTYTFKKYSK